MVYTSSIVRGFEASVTNWIVNEHNSIQALNEQVIVNNANDFPGAVIRAPNCASGPPCPIVSVNRTFTNFGDIDWPVSTIRSDTSSSRAPFSGVHRSARRNLSLFGRLSAGATGQRPRQSGQ